MTAARGIALVVDDQSDSLASNVADQLSGRGMPVVHIPANRLGLASLHFERNVAFIDGAPVAAALFRAGPRTRFDEGFRGDDAAFASLETAAAWLAILSSPTVAVINRLDAEVWTSRSEWPIWRRRLLESGIACVDLDVGDAGGDYAYWFPWGGGVATPPGQAARRLFASALTTATGLETVHWAAGDCVPESPVGRKVGAVLRRYGVELGGVTLDSSGRVALCTAHPELDKDTARWAAPRLAQVMSRKMGIA